MAFVSILSAAQLFECSRHAKDFMHDTLSKTSLPSPTSADAFEALYRASSDPWDFATSPYEQHRYETILGSLQRTAYDTAFEPGCSIGALTTRLASRCRRVIATDIAPTAIRRAMQRCRQLGNVSVRLAAGSTDLPQEPLDLIVFSEIGYYFDEAALRRYASLLAGRLKPGGEFIAVHWLGRSPDHVLHGDAVHDTLFATLPLSWILGTRHDGFRIDSWVRT
jgi:SAM-dependent methyltransferase